MRDVQLSNTLKKISPLAMGSEAYEFLNMLIVEAGLSKETVKSYGKDLRGFLEYCGRMGAAKPAELGIDTVSGYLRMQVESGLSPATAARSAAAVRTFIKYMISRNLIDNDFTILIETPQRPENLPEVYSIEQIIKLLDSPDIERDKFFYRDKAILEILYASGMRASELARLENKDINFRLGYLRCTGKGNKERLVPLANSSISHIRNYLERERPAMEKPAGAGNLFLSRLGNPLDRTNIWRIVKGYAARAGIPNFTTHSFRHSFATHLLSGGADLRSVQEMLGHSSVTTTQIYTHLQENQLIETHKKHHPRG
ncbi:Tyrosine recombinase XerD [Sedimentisphaera cyanobacteriorum]|uniref:Tyrosine recombinase XerC n=1 Tax=Sedimentisphaera cyanobacteriorum TaxID=1940790 RepID=A0A1Q2HRJ3_9BACT|nr:tyrosine recombinase [Sedimentisphaera cyanobacteriorum]AQQ10042.1 Tyrosine recombinase XerD [Sedimentisphaera cyanobacteriorum]